MLGYFNNDRRPMVERIAELPPLFQQNPTIIAGQIYRGEPEVVGADNHAHTPARQDEPIIYYDCMFIANKSSEALKLSRHWGVAFIDCYFVGGAEEPVDIVRGGDIFFDHCDWESEKPTGRDLTLKGGARRVTFRRCTNLRQLRLGDYTKYDAKAVYPDGRVKRAGLFTLARPPVRETRIIDCGPMEICCIHAERPIAGPECRVEELPRGAIAAYFWGRAKFFKETNPAPEEEFAIDPREL